MNRKRKQILKNDWAPLLEKEFTKPYYLRLREFLKREYMTQTINPHMNDIFYAVPYAPFLHVDVVILGPHSSRGPTQGDGLSFSVRPGVKQPPSLVKILKELQSDLG